MLHFFWMIMEYALLLFTVILWLVLRDAQSLGLLVGTILCFWLYIW